MLLLLPRPNPPSTSLYPTKSCIYVHLFEGTEEKSAITVQETSHDSCFMQRPCNGQPRSSLTTVLARVISEAPQDSSRSSAHLCCTAQQCSSHNNLRSALTTSPPDLTPQYSAVQSGSLYLTLVYQRPGWSAVWPPKYWASFFSIPCSDRQKLKGTLKQYFYDLTNIAQPPITPVNSFVIHFHMQIDELRIH